MYNGGLCFHQGRWLIVTRDNKVVLYARAVVEAELKRPLRSDEIVHHINGVTDDDRPENLQVTTRAEHIAMHRADLTAARTPESFPRGERHHAAKMSDAEVADARARFTAGEVSAIELARQHDMHVGSVYAILSGRSRG